MKTTHKQNLLAAARLGHTGERCTVFVPSVPTPMTGAIYIIARNRVHRLDVPVTAMMKCISKWGASISQLLAAHDPAQRHVSQILDQTKPEAP